LLFIAADSNYAGLKKNLHCGQVYISWWGISKKAACSLEKQAAFYKKLAAIFKKQAAFLNNHAGNWGKKKRQVMIPATF
jgi:hypothetical protein